MGRLETVTRDGVLAESYVYDQQGNRLSEFNGLRNVSRSYTNDDEDKILYAGDDSYTFDLDGFLTTRSIVSGAYSGNAAFDYSSRGELLSASLPDGRVISNVHDPIGRRVAKSINGVVVEKYLWQGGTTLLTVYDGAGNLLQRFEYADGRMPVAMVDNGNVYYLAYDQVGNLRAVVDIAGNVVKRVDYDSFGNVLSDSNPSFTVPFGFAGGLHDRDTGLVRLGARDYDPATGKWTAKDPIDFGGGDLNLGSYVGQDPVNWVDPGGRDTYVISREIGGTEPRSALDDLSHTFAATIDENGKIHTFSWGNAHDPTTGYGMWFMDRPSDQPPGSEKGFHNAQKGAFRTLCSLKLERSPPWNLNLEHSSERFPGSGPRWIQIIHGSFVFLRQWSFEWNRPDGI